MSQEADDPARRRLRLNALRNRRFRRRRKAAQRLAERHAQMPELVKDYDSLVAALRARRIALGWTQLELDDRAGFQDGYTGKLESWQSPSGRVASAVTLPLWLEALGMVFKPVVAVTGTINEQSRQLGAVKRQKLPDGNAYRRRPRG